MQIYGPSQVHGAQSIGGPHASRPVEQPSQSHGISTTDQLDLSEAGQIAAQMSDVPEIRQERVDALRAAISSGTYETDEKLDVALERLLDEIG